jgi:cell division inhibitor SepF
MPGAMRKLGLYLGLVEDDEERYDAHGYAPDDDYDEPEPARRSRSREPRDLDAVVARRSFDDGVRTRGAVALDTPVRPAPVPVYDDPYRITTLHPRTYNEARTIGEHFRDGTPVIMNLTEMDDTDAKRLVDFAAGLSFGLRGRIERVTNKVFLLSPEHVEVTAEDKARIAENGFFNQS